MVIDWANRVNKRASLTFSNFQKRPKTNEIMKWSTLYNDILINTQTGDFKNYAVWKKSLPVWHFRVHFKCAHSLVLNQGHVRGTRYKAILILTFQVGHSEDHVKQIWSKLMHYLNVVL